MRNIEELLTLKRSGVLKPDTDNDWTEDESALIKRHFRNGERRDEIAEYFPAEADEVYGESPE